MLNALSKEELLFLKKKKQKNFFAPGGLVGETTQAPRTKKFFGYFFSKK